MASILALSVTYGDSSPKGRAKSTAGSFLIASDTLASRLTAWLSPLGELARERLRGRIPPKKKRELAKPSGFD